MAHSARVAKLREVEDRLNNLMRANQEEKKANNVAIWQNKSDEKVRAIIIQRRFEALQLRRESNVNERRRLLADKLLAEDAALKQELVQGKETPEQRRAKLAARARELAAKREATRQQTATALYEQAFMENCEVLRETNSKRLLYRTMDERTAQIEQRMASRIAEEEEKRYFFEMNETARQAAEQRYTDDKRKQKELQQATVRVLDEQVRAVEQRRADESSAKLQEIAELRALWDAMASEQEAADMADKDDMRRLAAELHEFNRLRQSELSERDRRERELDLQILQEALAREAADEAREGAAREKRASDMRKYREQLRLMAERDTEESAERDALIQEMADQQQAKRDAELAARDEARRRLMAEVDFIRQQQIRDKQAQHQAHMDEVAADRVGAEAAAAAEASEADLRRLKIAQRAVEQRLVIQTQMVAKAHIKAAEEDEKLRALEFAQQAEGAYISRVKETLVKTDPPNWHGRKKFDWFS